MINRLLFLDLILWIVTLMLIPFVDQVGETVILISLGLSIVGIIIPVLISAWNELVKEKT